MIALLTRAIPDALMPFTVTIVRAGTTTDRYGNEVRDWTRATRTATKAWVEQQHASEDTNDRDQLVSGYLLVLPLGVDIVALDRVEHAGATFEVDGPPSVVPTMRGPHHIEAHLKWVSG